jgi:hypothetical protein
VDAGNGVMAKEKQWRMRNPEANVALPNPPQITAGKVVGYKAR